MKSSLKFHFSILACGSLLATNQIFGQLTWDANNTGGGQTDGNGTWLNANQWWNGANNVTWSNGIPDSAIIGNSGAGGTITVGSVTAGTVLLDNFSGTYTFDGTANSSTLTQGGITIGANAGNVTFRNTAIAGSGGITMNGSGRLILGANPNATHTYTGSLIINNGTVMTFPSSKLGPGNIQINNGVLEWYWADTFTRALGSGLNQIQITGGTSGFGENGNTGLTVRLNNSNSYVAQWGSAFFNPDTLVLNAPTAQSNASLTWDNPIDLNGASRTIEVSTSTPGSGSGRALIQRVISDSLSGGAGLIKTGNGVLELNQNNTFTGGITINQGTVRASSNNNALGSGGPLAFTGGGSTLDLRVSPSIGALSGTASNGLITAGAAGARTLTINQSTDTTFGGVIENGLGTVSITKTGTGALTLSGTNTYTGATTVSEGTLIINGSISTSSVTVATGATLAGSGSSNGATTINGNLNPGTSPGVMNFGSSLTLGSTATTTMEIDGTTLGTGYDHVNVASLLTYGGALVLDIGTVFGPGDYDFNLFDFGSQTGDFDSVTLADQYSGSLTETAGVWSLTSGDNTWTFTQSTGDLNLLVLNASAIPEPHTALLSALGLLALFRRRR